MPSVDVSSIITNLNPRRHTSSTYRMPVLSPRHSSSTTLSGSYRSTFSSSSIDRPYYGSSSSYTSPRLTYSTERYTSRSYSTAIEDGKKLYARHPSIAEDTNGSRYRDDSREKSTRRDSYTRETSIRSNSLRDSSRELSLTRNDASRSALSMVDSVADLRSKYSPANYVPAVLRKSDSVIARSKSINDIGRPPVETTKAKKDISTSPRLNRASIQQQSQAQSSSSQQSGSNNLSSTSRNSSSPTIDRERNNRDDDRHNYTTSGSHSVRNQGLNGLKNIGNTCFMNSVIQCLSNTRYLLEYVKEDAYISDINTTISGMKGALIKAFSQVIKELWSPDSSDRVVNTVALKSQIQRFAPRFMGYAQQDAQEFLRYLLEGLHEDVNRVVSKPAPILTEIEEKLSDSQKSAESWHRYLRMDNSKVVDIFVGQLKSTLRCTHCGHCSVTFDPFWDLSLPIPQRQGQLRLSQCLEHFTREETLDGDEKPTCAKCKERRKCTKSFSIQKFPKILVIHLKRFSPTERFRGKLSIVIDFPLQELDLSSCAANKSQTECVYNLYAISNHSGTTYSGHYTAYCKHPYNGQWHEYNDSRVSTISPKNVVSSEAYVLFYELVGQHSHL